MFAILALFERVQIPAPKTSSVGAFDFQKSRRLQREPVTGASIYAVPTAKGAVCYAVGPPVVSAQCVQRLHFGISLEVDQRDRSCASSFVAHGLTANDVVTVGLSAVGRMFKAPVRRNSFLIELPANLKPSQIQAVVITYSDKPKRSVPLAL